MNLIEENIQNLVNLWRLAGQIAGDHIVTAHYEMSAVTLSDWPNRIWFEGDVSVAVLEELACRFRLPNFTLPVWGPTLESNELVLQLQGYELKFEQYAMSIPLNNIEIPHKRLKLIKVIDQSMAYLWSTLFTKAFGYLIHPETVVKTMEVVDYYVAMYGAQPVGTGVIFFSQKHIAGIHSMGIVPEMRRKGFARNVLLQLLAISKQKGAHYAFLQASDSGKPLYQQVGFKEDFIIKNYIKS
ncbi:MAG: GNAT family N-acetyltransferase [Fulvivirga sp.]